MSGMERGLVNLRMDLNMMSIMGIRKRGMWKLGGESLSPPCSTFTLLASSVPLRQSITISSTLVVLVHVGPEEQADN
jgi:hypothetical protein